MAGSALRRLDRAQPYLLQLSTSLARCTFLASGPPRGKSDRAQVPAEDGGGGEVERGGGEGEKPKNASDVSLALTWQARLASVTLTEPHRNSPAGGWVRTVA